VPPTANERQEDRETLKVGLRHAARHGITTMHNMDGNRYMLEVLREVEEEGNLISRVKVPFHLTAEMDISELDRASAMTRDFTGDTLSCNFVKIFLDGVIASGTAAMIEPYANRPGHRGDMLFTREDFIAAATEIDKRGMQIAIHAIGDAAVRLALDGYEAAANANGPRDRRHRIEHVEMLHPDDLGRFAELGVVASMQPPHAPVREDETTVGIGPDRAGMAYAWRTIADTGAMVAFSSDWPIVPISPLAGIQAAMTRKNWAEGLRDQRLELHDVLAAYTRNGAFVGYAEDLTGMIRPGMKADLALLSGDIEKTKADRIGAMEVDLTLFDGRVSHER
jgi:predicted amidohydrolase YtcJ